MAKVYFNPKTEEEPKCQGKRQHKTLENFSGLSLKSWLLWSSPLLLIHKKADRLFRYLLGFKKACSSCRKDPSSHCSKITQNWTSYCHSHIVHWRLPGLYIALMTLAEYYWQLAAAHRAPVADAYLKKCKTLECWLRACRHLFLSSSQKHKLSHPYPTPCSRHCHPQNTIPQTENKPRSMLLS